MSYATTHATTTPERLVLRARAGFSLVELLVALTITAVIGVAMTGLFVTQARFLEVQAKSEFARGVTRGATNVMMSEMRMIDRDSGVIAALDTAITLRVPFAMGIVCATAATTLTISLLPVDSVLYAQGVAAMVANQGGFAYRQAADGKYKYHAAAAAPVTVANSTCTTPGIAVLSSDGGVAKTLATTALLPAAVGQPVMLYQNIRYHFNTSTTVPGRRALFRMAAGTDDELVAPFDSTAKFGFYVNDSKTPQTSPPTNLKTLTGFDLNLNSVSERPNKDGTYTKVPMRTAVFFKNRRD